MARHSTPFILLWLLLGLSAPCRAHDMGAMQILCTFAPNGSYTVEVQVDREHLPFRMARTPALDFAATFLQQSQFRFNDQPHEPRLDAVLQGAQPNQFLVRLQGTVPMRASTFVFSSQLDVNAYLLRLKNAREPFTLSFWLDKDAVHPPFDLDRRGRSATMHEVIREYVALGFTHILPKGLDHILFVLGLFLLSARTKPLLLQVSAFTLAHSITLALSIYDVIALPARIVEPLIALSIVYVALENLALAEYRAWRPAIVFAFGLLHGLGFAGVLTELGLPREQFTTALVSFNVGVELGQLAVILAALLCVGTWFGRKPWYRHRVIIPGSITIALVGSYWTVERMLA